MQQCLTKDHKTLVVAEESVPLAPYHVALDWSSTS